MPPDPSNAPQAKVLQSRAARTLIVVIVLGAMVLGLKWYQSNKSDFGDAIHGKTDTVGMVEAIEYGDNGDHIVVFNEKGEKIDQAAIKAGARDEDPVWRPDGGRIFYVSDRDGKSYQVYRWVPATGNEPEKRSVSTQGKSHPTFAPDASDPNSPMLLISGGFVQEFNASEVKGHQVLPPQESGVTVSQDEAGGSGSTQFQGIYGQLGDRFRLARWEKGTDAIVAIMDGDRGEVLVYQDLTKAEGKAKSPVLLATGGHIDFDISPKDGAVVYTVQGFAWQPNSAVAVANRFRHSVMIWHPGDKGPTLLLPSKDDSAAFGSPAISPGGDRVLLVEGAYNRASETLEAKALIIMPTEGNASAGVSKLVNGAAYEPAWNAKGDTIAYAKVSANGSRAIYVSGADGSNEHTLTGDHGSYGHPLFSPQVKG